MILRDYQQDAVKAIKSDLTGNDSTLLVLATGCGKTVTFARIIADRAHLGRALVVAHRAELIYQAAETIRTVTGLDVDIEMGQERADRSAWGQAPVIVATVQTLASRYMNRLCGFNPSEFATVIIDEAHHATGNSYRKVLGYFRHGVEDCEQFSEDFGEPVFVARRVPCDPPIAMVHKKYDAGLDGWRRKVSGNQDCKILGVTATPDRHDEESLGQIFDTVSYNYEIPDAISDGWLVPIKQRFVTVEGLDLSQVRTQAGDLNSTQLQKIMEIEENLHQVVHPTIELAKQRKTLVFAAGVDAADRMCEIFNRHKAGSAAFIHGKTDKEERKGLLKQYAAGEIQFMVNVGCLTEGFDDPGIEVVAMARPTKSRSLYSQMVGRGTRALPGVVDGISDPIARQSAIAGSAKPSLEVIDFVGNAGNHRLVTTLDMLGGNHTIEAVEKAISDAQDGGAWDSAELLEKTEEEMRIENERILREANNEEEKKKRRKILAKALYSTTRVVDVFDVLGVEPIQVRGWNAKQPPTEKQMEMLRRRGVIGPKANQVKEHELNKGTATQLIDSLMKRQNEKTCTYKQAKLLGKFGYPQDMTFADASTTIDALVRNGWRR